MHRKKVNIFKISYQKLNKENSTSCWKLNDQFSKLIRESKDLVFTPNISVFFENLSPPPPEKHIYSTFCYLQYTISSSICTKIQNLIDFSQVMLLICKEYEILSIPRQKRIFLKKDDKFSSNFPTIMIVTMKNKTGITIHVVRPKIDLWNLLTLFNYLHQKF